MWGAALHEQATGVHRPLTATSLLLEALDGGSRLLVLGIDHCLLEAAETNAIKSRVRAASGIPPEQIHIALSHTHGSAWLSRSRSHLPGGHLIGPYLDSVGETCAKLAKQAAEQLQPATIVYGTSRCSLAAHRDFWDETSQQIVCGFNPDGFADDTVMLAKVVIPKPDAQARVLGTVVNYACHPTTLAWENTLVSPDFVGAMREVVERETNAPCLFLQGASGELGPREGFVGDTAIADRNGRQLGFAALSGLEAMPPPGTFFEYAGPVVSGATLGTWKHQPLSEHEKQRQELFASKRCTVPLAYRVDLPTRENTQAELVKWQTLEEAAAQLNDAIAVRNAHAQVERMNRQLTRLESLPAGRAYPFPVGIWRLGDSLWIFTAGEQYQAFQTSLRERFPHLAVMVATISDDWQPGYLPAAASFGYGIYQETIAAVAPGALEALIEAVTRECRKLLR
ncbi:MAG TPA: hypothetical protein VGL71_05130, partial [Urbifossiella sp.]